MFSQPAQKLPSSSELLPSEKTVDDKPPAQNPHRGADAKDATAAPIKEERKSRSLVMDICGDCPSELFDFLQTTHSCDLPETPCRKLSFGEGDPTPPFVKTSPPTVSTKASGSQEGSPDSSQTAPTDGPPKAKLFEAPVPGKKFGFGNAFKPSNLQFRSKSTDSNLGDQTTPTKSDIDLMKSEIEKAKEVVKQEKKTGKAAGDAANSKESKPGPVGHQAKKAQAKALLRKSSSDVLGLAAAVKGLKLSPAQKSASKPKGRGKKKPVEEEEQEEDDIGSPEEDASEGPESFEKIDSDEEINKEDRVSEAKSGKQARKKKQPKATSSQSQSKGKGAAKAEPKRKSTGSGSSKGETEKKEPKETNKRAKTPVENAEKNKKRPCMESFLAKEWLKFRDEKMQELKGTKPYHQLLKDIAALWKTQPARKAAAEGLSSQELKRVLKDPQAIPCRWENDQSIVILEVAEDGSRRLKDTSPCTIRSLLLEFETNGMVETTLNGHEYVRPEGSSGDVDFFEIKADEQNPLVFKFSAIPHKTIEQGAVKFTSLASQFNNRELMDGKMLQMCWRVSYSQDDQEVSPKKPLYFLKQKLTLTKGQAVLLGCVILLAFSSNIEIFQEVYQSTELFCGTAWVTKCMSR
ncbi:unnamed protein product, partial [Symbiodinium sp. KB8]